MNPSAASLISLILPAIPGLITVAQILIKDGPHKMTAVIEAIRAMLSRATPDSTASGRPVTEALSDDQLRVIVETILAEQKRTGNLPPKKMDAEASLSNHNS